MELFEGRLPRSCVSLLRGKHFEVQEAGNCVDRIYESLQTDPATEMWLGRNVTGTLFENTSDYFQTPEAFSRMVKVSTVHPGIVLNINVYSTHTCPISSPTLWQCYLPNRLPQTSPRAGFPRLSGISHHLGCMYSQILGQFALNNKSIGSARIWSKKDLLTRLETC